MLCGIGNEKIASVAPPRSPASTAGYSTPLSAQSFASYAEDILHEIAEDVLIIGSTSWTLSLTTSEDIARLCRCVTKAHEPFASPSIHAESLISWRLFQAADRNYNGYVTPVDLYKVLVSMNPRIRVVEDVAGDNLTMLYWDTLVWWTNLDLSDADRRIVERNVMEKLVVPSDGLWAGLSLSALLRVWKTVCRSTGYLFRYETKRYLESTFASLKSQSRTSDLDLVLYLIQETISRLGKHAGKMWEAFLELDTDDDGRLSEAELHTLLRKLNLKCVPIPTLPISRSTSDSSNMDDTPNEENERGCGTQFSLIQMLDAMLESCEIVITLKSDHSAVPGQRTETYLQLRKSWTSKWKGLWKKMTKPQRKRPSMARHSSTFNDSILRVYIRTLLNLEQWRGQKLAGELCGCLA